MNDAQIKHMVNRFLGWRLPDDFRPDAGISFTATYNTGTPYEGKHQPSGTNLLSATQAEAMIRHLVEGLDSSAEVESLRDDKETLQNAIDGAAEALIGDGCEFDPTSVADELAPHVSEHLRKDLRVSQPLPN